MKNTKKKTGAAAKGKGRAALSAQQTIPYLSMHPDGVCKLPDGLYRQCGLSKDYHLHTLRHFYATYLLQEGTSKQVAASLLGHADTAFLERTYCHPQDAVKLQAANLMQDLLNSQNPCYVAFMKNKNRKVKKAG